MEVVYDKLMGKEIVTVENLQLKSEHKTELPENAKKIMGVNCQVLGQNNAVQDNEIVLTGNIMIRLIFINEFDKYDSKDIVEPYEKKLTVKDLSMVSDVCVHTQISNTQWVIQENVINVANVLDVVVKGIKCYETQFVSDLTGDVEVRKLEHKILTFHTTLQDKFEIEENLDLDKNCEGVLGVDANALIKDVAAADGKVIVKGVIAANVIGVKTVDNGSVPYNITHEIDFAKSIVATGVTSEDLAVGNVCVNAITMRIENDHKGSMLVLQIELLFNGCAYVYQKFDTVVDAISFDKELTFETSQIAYREIAPQVNTTVDIENNLNLPTTMPYIARVLAVDSVKVNHLEVTTSDGKIALDGTMAANILVENEEHIVTNYTAAIPFQTHVRMDNLDASHAVEVQVVPMLLNIKARRGVELLVDAKLGVSIQSCNQANMVVVTSVVVGKDKVEDSSAIRIYIIGEKENLWDLAKRTNLSCADLLKQNPNLENGCMPGERIVVYRHETVQL